MKRPSFSLRLVPSSTRSAIFPKSLYRTGVMYRKAALWALLACFVFFFFFVPEILYSINVPASAIRRKETITYSVKEFERFETIHAHALDDAVALISNHSKFLGLTGLRLLGAFCPNGKVALVSHRADTTCATPAGNRCVPA